MKFKSFSLFSICTLLLTASTFAVAAPAIGQPAPDFAAKGSDGKDYRLADFRGKYVVLEWFNPQCPFVHKHYDSGNMQSLQARYTQKGVVWLSIDSSASGSEGYMTPEDAQAKRKEWNIHSTATLLDPAGTVGRLYAAKTTPHMFVIDPKGLLIYEGAIDDRRSADVADIKGARNYVAEALDQAMAGKAVTMASTRSYGCSVKYQ